MRFTIIRTTLLTALVCGVAGAAILAAAADYPSQSQVYERPPAEVLRRGAGQPGGQAGPRTGRRASGIRMVRRQAAGHRTKAEDS